MWQSKGRSLAVPDIQAAKRSSVASAPWANARLDQPDSRTDPNKDPETAIELAQRVRPELVAALLEDDPRCEPGA
jgi:hypothetical protein